MHPYIRRFGMISPSESNRINKLFNFKINNDLIVGTIGDFLIDSKQAIQDMIIHNVYDSVNNIKPLNKVTKDCMVIIFIYDIIRKITFDQINQEFSILVESKEFLLGEEVINSIEYCDRVVKDINSTIFQYLDESEFFGRFKFYDKENEGKMDGNRRN